VHTAVKFHDQAPPRAAKIHNVLTERVLPAKLEALEFDSPE
jgi:hypothetical protein